jgi:hypothetical protein
VSRGWRTGHGAVRAGRAVGRWAAALVLGTAIGVAVGAGSAAAQQTTPPTRSTKLQQIDTTLCDTTPVKVVRRVRPKPKAAAAHRLKAAVRPKPVVAAKPVVRKPHPAVARAAGHRVRPTPAAPRKPNCVKAAAAVAPTPEAKKALVAALPWTAPAEVTVPELSPFSLPGTIGSRSNAWALGLAGLSAFYFVGHDHSSSAVIPPPPPPPPTVTPEPASIALLGTGLLALGAGAGLKRRRKREKDR